VPRLRRRLSRPQSLSNTSSAACKSSTANLLYLLITCAEANSVNVDYARDVRNVTDGFAVITVSCYYACDNITSGELYSVADLKKTSVMNTYSKL